MVSKTQIPLWSPDFLADAEKYGISYAFIQAEKRAKGRNLSASEYGKTEKAIRALVNSNEGETMTAVQVADLATLLSASPYRYADFTGVEDVSEVPCSFAMEKNPCEWVRHKKASDKLQGAKPKKEPTKSRGLFSIFAM